MPQPCSFCGKETCDDSAACEKAADYEAELIRGKVLMTPDEIRALRAELGPIDIQRYDEDDGRITYQLEIGSGKKLRIIGAVHNNRIIAEGFAALPDLLDALESAQAERDQAIAEVSKWARQCGLAEGAKETAETLHKGEIAELQAEVEWLRGEPVIVEFDKPRIKELEAELTRLRAFRDALTDEEWEHAQRCIATAGYPLMASKLAKALESERERTSSPASD